jgi:hypothetical protein
VAVVMLVIELLLLLLMVWVPMDVGRCRGAAVGGSSSLLGRVGPPLTLPPATTLLGEHRRVRATHVGS